MHIPAGVDNGSRVRVAGKGGPGSAGAPPGDLFIRVGAYALGSRVPFSAPVDLTFNLGLRLDTFIGVFELSLGNALGRLPL